MDGLLAKDIIEVALKHLTDRIILSVLFISVFLFALFGIKSHLPMFLSDWLVSHEIWIFFGIISPPCYLLTGPVLARWHDSEAAKKEDRQHRRAMRQKQNLLHQLTAGDKEFLKRFEGEIRSVRESLSNPIAKGLEDSGILYAPNVPFDSLGRKAYNIQNWVREYLKEHPELLK